MKSNNSTTARRSAGDLTSKRPQSQLQPSTRRRTIKITKPNPPADRLYLINVHDNQVQIYAAVQVANLTTPMPFYGAAAAIQTAIPEWWKADQSQVTLIRNLITALTGQADLEGYQGLKVNLPALSSESDATIEIVRELPAVDGQAGQEGGDQ